MNIKNKIAATLLALPALAGAQVSVSVGQPGFYGRIDVGDYPSPRLIYAEPRLVERVRVRPAPVYLRVPPGHAKHWEKHCQDYGACARPVYFVQDDWYETVYVREYRDRHDDNGGDGHPGRGHGKDKSHKGKGNGKH